MNKTVTVNLGGTVFHIDDNAYESLIKYLNAIKGHFSSDQGRDEIMQDIESRIGEMFRERLNGGRQVITLNDVNEVTAVMGRPEEFAGGEEKATEAPPSMENASSGKLKKRFFRDPDEKFVGGVCSGMAAYFDIDPVWIRLVFACALIFYGTGFWIYILLWIIIPEAKTTADRLMMRGEPVTVSSIEKNVREELDALKDRMKDGQKSTTAIGRIFETIGDVFKFIFLLIGKIITAFFVFIALVIAVALLASLFGLVGAPFVHYPGFLNHIFNSTSQFSWIYVGVVLLIAIPALMIAYAGIRFLFKIKRRSRVFGFTALGIWLVALAIVMFSGFSVFSDFSETDSFRKEVALQQPASKYMVLETNESKNSESDYDYGGKYYRNMDTDFDLESDGHMLISKNVKLDIVKSPIDSFDLVEIFYAQGSSRKAAIDNASRISYSFTQTDSSLRLNRFFNMNEGDKWRAQKVQLLLRMPVGARVRLDESLRNLIHDIDNVKNIYDNDMINRTWEMTPKGLSCVDCDGTESILGGDFNISNDYGDESDAKVEINKNGLHITNEKGDKVVIDSTGIHVRENGKDVVNINTEHAKKKQNN
ncbi:MAG: PspC domain-containing protein [Bacteroidetes bacterium]|nr:PspC domain-containing protein [Bacteroidota bacterium]